jgi:hypothetical protein
MLKIPQGIMNNAILQEKKAFFLFKSNKNGNNVGWGHPLIKSKMDFDHSDPVI